MNGKKKISLSKDQLQIALEAQVFECASIGGGACPSGISRLFIYNAKDPEDSHVCSGFLNGSNKLVTNNHCVSGMTECRNTQVVVYNGLSYEKAKCKSIVQTKIDSGALNLKGVDFTVMELDRSINVVTFPIANNAPIIGELLTAWVIDHQSLTNSRITELTCQYRSLAKSMQFANCPVIQGNSGSPMVNEMNEIVGLIWGTTVDEEIDATVPLEERRAMNEFAMVTELKHFKDYLISK